MYSETVEVDLGDGIKCSVTVSCTPDTPESELQYRALNKVLSAAKDKALESLHGTNGNGR